jgi:VanZ family protein
VTPVVLPELRHGRLWVTGGVCLAVAIAVLSLVPGEQLPEVRLWDKLQHILAYVALACWFASIVVRRKHVWVVLALLCFGALIELLQGQMGLGRQADLHDLGANALGIAAGLLLALTPLGRWAVWLESAQRQTLP